MAFIAKPRGCLVRVAIMFGLIKMTFHVSNIHAHNRLRKFHD
jgi:hypothetical protein